jgi:hypothetical protein
MKGLEEIIGRRLRWMALLAIGVLVMAGTASAQNTYYFAHLVVGEHWQSTITYINYSPQAVTCTTNFFSDSGAPLAIPIGGGAAASSRVDNIPAGGSVHVESSADPNAAVPTSGWAKATCTGPVTASLLFRLYLAGKAVAEAGVNALSAPKTKFVTFAEKQTGVAYTNPSVQDAVVTFNIFDSAGQMVGSHNEGLAAGQHKADNLGPLLGLTEFTGSVEITSTVPIISLSLNFEANAPGSNVFSSLPPGDVDAGGPYYFSHLVLGGNAAEGVWQTTITYINSSQQPATCTTNIFDVLGGPLPVSFGGGAASPTRTDIIPAGGTLHVESTAGTNSTTVQGWAKATCTQTVKASLLFRRYFQNQPKAEAALNAISNPTTKFVSFGEKQTGVALVNPTVFPGGITVTALNPAGQVVGTTNFFLLPQQHIAENLGPFLPNFPTGSIHITNPVQPFVALSLNFEATTPGSIDSVFSPLPPGELDSSTPLATGN